MTLRLADKWVWDFWFAQDGPDYHVFYLQADRALGDPDLRHWNVSVGHAVSQDLCRWDVLPDAIRPAGEPAPGQPEAWDSYTTWTGSIVPHAGRWYLFYTGSRRSERGLVQRIGLATSDDLVTWTKHPDNPLVSADPQWYELLDLAAWHDQAWRDPYVIFNPADNLFHMAMTARANAGTPDARGVIGHATSPDLITWTVQPPLVGSGQFGHLEVPQIVPINGRFYLLFSTVAQTTAAARTARLGMPAVSGTHYYASEDMLGPYRMLTDEFLVGDPVGELYSGKLIQGPDGAWKYMAFRNETPTQRFIGELSDPLPVTIAPDGRLAVER